MIVYNPLDQFEFDDQYNWDNWHTDFGLLATVVHPIYFNKQGKPYSTDCTCFVLRDRLGNEHKGFFHENEFMVTAGDAMVIESSGYIPATPHTVRIEPGMPTSIYRVQSVSFFEPYLNYQMRTPTQENFSTIIERNPFNHDYSALNNFQEGCYYKTFLDDLLEFLYQ